MIKFLLNIYFRLNKYLSKNISGKFAELLLQSLGAKYNRPITFLGFPYLVVKQGGILSIGRNLVMISNPLFNMIGRYDRCTIYVESDAKLTIGDNVGISYSAVFCASRIEIGNNVTIGGNTVIYDTDFHSINYNDRHSKKTDTVTTVSRQIIIHDDVFIGAGSTILKGVEIGERSIIAAGSVVTKNIPSDQIWGGNPAKFIREIG